MGECSRCEGKSDYSNRMDPAQKKLAVAAAAAGLCAAVGLYGFSQHGSQFLGVYAMRTKRWIQSFISGEPKEQRCLQFVFQVLLSCLEHVLYVFLYFDFVQYCAVNEAASYSLSCHVGIHGVVLARFLLARCSVAFRLYFHSYISSEPCSYLPSLSSCIVIITSPPAHPLRPHAPSLLSACNSW